MFLRSSFAALGLAASLTASVFAGDIPSRMDEVVKVELLPGWRNEDGTHIAALSFQLAKGWKTYWRAPGDGGLPTYLDHTGSDNVKALHVLWPRPEVFRTRGLRSIGYQESVVLPLHLETNEAEEIDLNLSVSFGVCEDVCIPVHMQFHHRLEADALQPDARINAALEARPNAGHGSVSCTFSPQTRGTHVAVNLHAPVLPGRGEAVVIETAARGVWISEPRVQRDGDYLTAHAKLVAQDGRELDPDPGQMRVTVISSLAAVSYEGCSSP